MVVIFQETGPRNAHTFKHHNMTIQLRVFFKKKSIVCICIFGGCVNSGILTLPPRIWERAYLLTLTTLQIARWGMFSSSYRKMNQ